MNVFHITHKVFGKNLSIGNHYSVYCKKKIKELLSKYATNVMSYNASLERKNYFYKVKLRIIIIKSIEFETTGKSKFPYKALNFALLNMSKRIRSYVRRQKLKRKGRKKTLNIKESFLFSTN